MPVFDELETAADSLLGSGVGGWVLGAVMVVALLLPIGLALFAKNAGKSGQVFILVIAAFAIVFDVGVGWWEPWTLVFIALVIGFSWWMFKGGGEGGV